MAIKILQRGSKGANVKRWQNFLIGLKFLLGPADGKFGELSVSATKAFQRSQEITADGIVGPKTFGVALLNGFDMGFEEPIGVSLLPGTSDLKSVRVKDRIRMFGEFDFNHDPKPNNPERITIRGSWVQNNIKTVQIPQLKGISVYGTPSKGRMRFHRKAADQLIELWQQWASAGLLDCILTFEGSYNARFIRGSRYKLSSHAFGSAFDINAGYNGLGAIPALEGEKGSVRELVNIANAHGFYWGGHYKNRPDGMHFEVSKLL